MWAKWVEWRRTFDVDGITPESVESEVRSGKAFWFGHDKQRRPCVVILPRNHHPHLRRSAVETMRFAVWMVERGIERAAALGSSRFCVIYDREGMTAANRDPSLFTLLRDLVTMLQDNYADRLGALYVLKVNWWFWAIYKLVSPLLSAETKAKVHILDDGKQLLEFFEPDQLQRHYGGTADFVYRARDLLGPSIVPGDEVLVRHEQARLVVPNRSSHQFELEVRDDQLARGDAVAAGEGARVRAVVVRWRFSTEAHDIRFAAEWRPLEGAGEPVREALRVPAHLERIEGHFVARRPGRVLFVWDNSYSMFTRKTLSYEVAVVAARVARDEAEDAAPAPRPKEGGEEEEQQMAREFGIERLEGKELASLQGELRQ
jgi:hypothetical protein